MRWVLALVLLAVGQGALPRDLDGRQFDPFEMTGPAHVVFFVTSDCPISNGYAPEIGRLCDAYATKGVSCSLVFEDVALEAAGVRSHAREYRLERLRATIDADRRIARRLGAEVTPQAVLVDRAGTVRYRGRIDNRYAAFGTTRRVVTVHDLRDALDAVLAGRAVAVAETKALGCHIVWKAPEE